MLTPEEIRQVKRWHPDEIKRYTNDTLTFMWSPVGGLFVGWPMDSDPTRGNRPMPMGTTFRPNHAELIMMTPDFDRKFFGDDPAIAQQLHRQPFRQRELVDIFGLSGRVGRQIDIEGHPRTVCTFWESPNLDAYVTNCIAASEKTLALDDDTIVYCWKHEAVLLGAIMQRRT
jgi:hypothetical protein